MVKVRANLGLLHLLLALDQPQSRKVCKDRIGMTKQTGAGMVNQTGAGMANQIGAGMTKQTGARMATQAGLRSPMMQNRAQVDQTCAAVASTFDVKATNYLSRNLPRSRQKLSSFSQFTAVAATTE